MFYGNEERFIIFAIRTLAFMAGMIGEAKGIFLLAYTFYEKGTKASLLLLNPEQRKSKKD